MQKKFNYYLQLIRPLTLPAGITPVLIGLALVSQKQSIHIPYALTTILCAVIMQSMANVANDFFDGINGIDNHERIGPIRMIQSGLLTMEEVKAFMIVLILITLMMGQILSMFVGPSLFFVGIVCIMMAYFYSAGPYPLSKKGLGELLALIFFGPVPVLGTYYIQTKTLNWHLFPISLAPGFLAVSLMATNNLRDRITDKKVGKITLANIFSEKVARFIPVISFIIPSLIALYYFIFHKGNAFLLFPTLAFLPFLGVLKKFIKDPIDSRLNYNLRIIGKYMIVFCIFLTYGLYKSHK